MPQTTTVQFVTLVGLISMGFVYTHDKQRSAPFKEIYWQFHTKTHCANFFRATERSSGSSRSPGKEGTSICPTNYTRNKIGRCFGIWYFDKYNVSDILKDLAEQKIQTPFRPSYENVRDECAKRCDSRPECKVFSFNLMCRGQNPHKCKKVNPKKLEEKACYLSGIQTVGPQQLLFGWNEICVKSNHFAFP